MISTLFWLCFWGLIIWLIVRSAKSNSGKTSNNYDRGYSEGYWRAIDSIEARIAERGQISQADVNEITGRTGVIDTPLESSSQASSGNLGNYAVVSTKTVETEHQAWPYVEPGTDVASQNVELADTRQTEKSDTMRNLNVLLGLSSLLFVAAGIAFIASSLPDIAKLLGILTIMVVFYGGGVVLYVRSAKLRPAAVAFIGTGLALMPFVAVVLNAYGGVPSQWAWFIASVCGVLAYGAAAMLLQSQLVAYLTVGFLLSFIGSGLGVGDTALIWYFVAMISVSLVLSVISSLKSSWLPEVFRSSVMHTGQVLAPVTLVASLLMMGRLETWHYQVLTGLTAFNYFVAWLQTRRVVYAHVARLLAQILAMIICFQLIPDNRPLLAFSWVVVSIVHQLVSMFYVMGKESITQERSAGESIWVIGQFALQIILSSMWFGHNDWAIYISSFYSIWLLLGMMMARVFHQSGFLYPTVVASLVLPGVVSQFLISPAWPLWTIPLMHALGVGLCLALHRWLFDKLSIGWRVANMVSVIMHFMMATIFLSLIEAGVVSLALGVALYLLVIVSSHVYRNRWPILALIIIVQIIGRNLVAVLGLTGQEAGIVWAFNSAIMVYLTMTIYWILGDKQRGLLLLGMANLLLIPVALSLLMPSVWFSATEGKIVAVLILLVGLVGNFVAKKLASADQSGLYWLSAGSYLVYYLIILPITLSMPSAWLAAMLALGIAIVTELSYSGKLPGLMYVANILTVWMVSTVLGLSNLSGLWQLAVTVTITGSAFYLLHWFFWQSNDSSRRLCMLVSSWIVLFGGSLLMTMFEGLRLYGAMVMLAGAITLAADGLMSIIRARVEVAVYVGTLAVSVMISQAWPQADFLIYVHLWAINVASVAVWLKNRYRQSMTSRLAIAMGLITFFTSLSALSSGGWYSLIFLVEHIGLLVAGVISSRTWAIRWGIIASVLAVVYYMRESPYLLFATLGVAVIGFVIWRLRKIK